MGASILCVALALLSVAQWSSGQLIGISDTLKLRNIANGPIQLGVLGNFNNAGGVYGATSMEVGSDSHGSKITGIGGEYGIGGINSPVRGGGGIQQPYPYPQPQYQIPQFQYPQYQMPQFQQPPIPYQQQQQVQFQYPPFGPTQNPYSQSPFLPLTPNWQQNQNWYPSVGQQYNYAPWTGVPTSF